jgi:hypothetical protein
LPPAPPVDEKQLAGWVANLGSDDFSVRQKATQSLEQMDDLAEQALRDALSKQPSLEAGRRMEQLLRRITGPVTSPKRLQALRAVEMLEYIGTDSRALLQTLASGAPQARVTRDAKESLERLRQRSR